MTRLRQIASGLLVLISGLSGSAEARVSNLLSAIDSGGSGGGSVADEGAAGLMAAGQSVLDLLGKTLFKINETPVTTMGLLRVALILTAAMWLSRVIRRTIQRIGQRRGGLNQSSLYTFGRLVHYVILTIGIIVGLSSIGIDFTKFAMFASALGVGVGFGLQTLISNFVAGLIILFEKSLKVGDFVELESGVTGEVKEINMRSTLITTNDNIDILVPNAEFVGGRVTNWTLRDVYRRIRIPFGVAYGTEKEKVKTAALEAADEVEWTLKNDPGREPQVWFVEFGDSSLNFELVVWLTQEAVKRPGAVSAAYLWELDTKLSKYGIEIPFPQRDLHLRSAFGLRDAAARNLFEREAAGPPRSSN
jgi:small-conductance mechanosensitive channel